MEPLNILDTILKRYKTILDRNLVGIYIHGSLAMGCYNHSISDIDFLVVIRDPIGNRTKRELIEAILHLDVLPKKGIEMSLILEKYAKEFVHPTPFELHYSDSQRERYLADGNYICGGFTDRDLAAHFTIIKHRGICLFGKQIDVVFGNVPREDYIDSIMNDIEHAQRDILDNPVYIILNLCRVLYYLKDNVICSKLEGGNWGMETLPEQYRSLVKDAVNIYVNRLDDLRYGNDFLIKFATYMHNEINRSK